MGYPSSQASNAVIYTTYAVFLCFGLFVGWKFSRTKGDFLASLRTQSAFPLALNFSASAMGAGILFTYPEVAGVAGLQGVLVYSFASSLPFLTFPPLAKRLRELCPHGFVLTEFVRERFGVLASLFLSACSCLTMFIYMISELTSISGAINRLTGLNGLPATIVEVVVTLLYTAFGGFRTSLITDNVQGVMIIFLLILCTVAIGVNVRVDKGAISSSGTLDASLLGWQLIYILPVAIIFNNYFLSGYWQRAFASKSDRDLWAGCVGASVIVFVFLTLVGFTGLIAIWAGVVTDVESEATFAFFILLGTLKPWVVCVVIVFAISLSCSAYDTQQTALVATISNDVFRNKISIWWVRLILIVNVPAVVVAAKNLNILVLYLISDLLSAAVVPPILLGLIPRLNFLHGFDIIVGGLGGIFTVFLFGTVYYGNAADGAGVLLLKAGLYGSDWSTFGAFIAAPVGSLLWTAAGFGARAAFLIISHKMRGDSVDVWSPVKIDTARYAAEAHAAGVYEADGDRSSDEGGVEEAALSLDTDSRK